MTLSDAAIVFGFCTTLITGTGAAGKYYLDHEYVQVSGLTEALDERDRRRVKKEIKSLEWDRDHGGLTDKEQWELQQLYQELESLQ